MKASRLLLFPDLTDSQHLSSNIDYYLTYYLTAIKESDDVCIRSVSPDLMILLLANALELAL